MKTQRTLAPSICALMAVFALASSGRAADYTWNSANAGTWDDTTANGWNTGGAYPNATNDAATFSQSIGANTTITLNVADATAGTLTLADTTPGSGWVLSGASPLTLNASSGTAILNIGGAGTVQNTHLISAPIVSTNGLDIQVGPGGRLGLSGDNSAATGGMTITGGGNGYVRFDSAASLGGPASPVTVENGSVAVIGFSDLSSTDLARFAASDGLLAFYSNVLSYVGDPWNASAYSPAANIDLTGFNESFRIGAAALPLSGSMPTLSGTFTPPSDTFRFGGGGGALVVNAPLADGGGARRVEIYGPERVGTDPSIVALSAANTYTGATDVVDGVLRIAGTNGSIQNTSAVNVGTGTVLQLDAGLKVFGWGQESGPQVGNNNDRVGDATPVNLTHATLNFFGNPDTGTTETVGALNLLAGLNPLDVRWQTGNVWYGSSLIYQDRGTSGTGAAVLTAASLNLTSGAQLWLRGVNVGVDGDSASRVMLNSSPTMVGGAGGGGSTTMDILPGAFHTSAVTASPNAGTKNWLTYDAAAGLRPLASGEYSTIVDGENSDNNTVYQQTGAGSTLTLAATTVNSVKFQFDLTSGDMTVGGTGPLTLKSGNLLVEGNPVSDGRNLYVNVPLDFNGRAGNIFYFTKTFTGYFLNSPMSNTGGNGVSLSAFNTALYQPTITIGGASTYTGPTAINAGYWSTSANERLPDTTGLVIQSGARLTIGNGRTETVASLEGNGALMLGDGNSRLVLGTGSGAAGTVTVDAGGTVAPTTTGALTLESANLVVNSGGTFAIDLDGPRAGFDYARLVVNGSVTLNGGDLDVTLGFMPTLGDTFFVLDNDGTDSIVGSFDGLPEGTKVMGLFGASPVGLRVYYGADLATGALIGGNDIALLHIPEPMSGLLLALGALAGLRRRRA